jgi:hypothetical protein
MKPGEPRDEMQYWFIAVWAVIGYLIFRKI